MASDNARPAAADEGIWIDDPAVEALIHELCAMTGEDPETAVQRAVAEMLARVKADLST